jgi:hypothetical protein
MRFALADVGLRHAGDQRRGADVGGAQVIAQLFHESLRGDLRHRVDAHRQSHEDGAGGGGGDDVAALVRAGLHSRHEGLRAIHGSPEVHAHAPIPVVVGAVDDAGLQADAGVVHQDADRAELLLDFIGLGFPAVAIHHVVDHGGHARIVGREHLQRVGKLLLIDVAEDHLCALFVQRARDAEANATGAAGDVGDLVLHVGDGGLLRFAHAGRRDECIAGHRGRGCAGVRSLPQQSRGAGGCSHAAQHLPAVQVGVVHGLFPREKTRS